MNKEIISKNQQRYLISSIIFSQVIVTSGYSYNGNGAWISMLLSALSVVPLFLIYYYIKKNNEEKNIFEIFSALFGKLLSRILIIIFSLYAIFVTTLYIRVIVLFIMAFSFTQTPQIFISVSVLFIIYLLIERGIEVLARSTAIIFPLVFLVSITLIAFLWVDMDLKNLLPLISEPLPNFFKASGYNFLNNFGDTALLLGVIVDVKNKDYLKTTIKGGLIGGSLMVIYTVANIATLGSPLFHLFYYPTYVTLSIIDLGQFITRIEVIASSILMVSLLIKCAVAMYVSIRGISHLFSIKINSQADYRKLYFSFGAICIPLSIILFKGVEDMHVQVYKFGIVKIIPQLLIPIFLVIVIYFKKLRNKKSANKLKSTN